MYCELTKFLDGTEISTHGSMLSFDSIAFVVVWFCNLILKNLMLSPQNGNNLTCQNSTTEPYFAGKPLENDKTLKTFQTDYQILIATVG